MFRRFSSLPRCNLPVLKIEPSPNVKLNRVAYLSAEVDVSLPAIIVLQDKWGVNNQIKSFAQTISDGAIASCFVPDLYSGRKKGIQKEKEITE